MFTGRKKRVFDWSKVFNDGKLLSVNAAAKRMSMNIPAARRHLLRAVYAGELRKVQWKKLVYFMVPAVYDALQKRMEFKQLRR